MLSLMKKRSGVSEADLDSLDHQAQRLGPLLLACQLGLDVEKHENVNIPKVHSALHYRYARVRKYGIAVRQMC